MNPTLHIPCFKMSNGIQIPVIGIGTSKTYGCDGLAIYNAIKFAVKFGYRHIDTAWIYMIDDLISEAIKNEFIESDHQIKRNDLFFTCKVWNHHHSKRNVRKAVLTSLKNLNIEYFDLYLIHSPMGFKEDTDECLETFRSDPYPRDVNGNILFSDIDYLETYKTMEEFAKSGIIKSLGVCNFNIAQLKDLLANSEIKPVVNQIEIHPYFQNDKLVNFCHSNGITVIAYCPLAEDSDGKHVPNLQEDETLIRIGKKYNKTPSQVTLRWLYQKGIVTIPRTLVKEKIIEHAHIFDFELDHTDMNDIRKINKNIRIHDSPEYNFI